MMPYCSCAEIKDNFGKDLSFVPKWHNCDYIISRNLLIPKALEKAEALSKIGNNEIDEFKFTYLFSQFMDEAAIEAGIV